MANIVCLCVCVCVCARNLYESVKFNRAYHYATEILSVKTLNVFAECENTFNTKQTVRSPRNNRLGQGSVITPELVHVSDIEHVQSLNIIK